MKLQLNLIALSLAFLATACAEKSDKVKVIVNLPETMAVEDKVNIVGEFNNWALSGEQATELKLENGQYVAELPNNNSDLFFTVVKNQDWQHMPASEYGKGLCTFHQPITSDTTEFTVDIPAWKSDKNFKPISSTASNNVSFIKQFYSPEFERNMDLAVYLPASYQDNTETQYPVLYMLDGQNVFDLSTSYSDEWRVDESFDHNKMDLIVVAVPNSSNRWQEYNPWDYVDLNGAEQQGQGKLTIDFIKNTLKPHIDKTYRTAASNTGLAGSSLGGMMALYAALEHSDTFSWVAAFSPSLSIHNKAKDNVLFTALNGKKLTNTKVYFDMGLVEYGDYEKVDQLNVMLQEAFGNSASEKLKMVKDDQGRHCELDWSKRFPAAIDWLTKA